MHAHQAQDAFTADGQTPVRQARPDLAIAFSTARSFWLRLARPAVRYQTDSARARVSWALTIAGRFVLRKRPEKDTPRSTALPLTMLPMALRRGGQ